MESDALPVPLLWRNFSATVFRNSEKLTGVLQLTGALGIILGFWIDYIQILSTLGLSLLMLFGVITRIVIKDGLIKTLPATFYCLLNGYLCIKLTLNFL